MEEGSSLNLLLPISEKITDLTTDSQVILQMLISSKEDGNSIAVASPVLGPGVIMTTVDDIILSDGDAIIRFRPFDSTGYFLATQFVSLHEISGVFPLKSEFPNPVLNNMEKSKAWFF